MSITLGKYSSTPTYTYRLYHHFTSPLRINSYSLSDFLTGSVPNKFVSSRGIQTIFLNYQLVVIKASCIYFTHHHHHPTPILIFTQNGAKTVMVNVKLQLPLGFNRGSELQESLPILQNPVPRLLGRKQKLQLQSKNGIWLGRRKKNL